MRIACVDLIFSWPPHGGADVDLFNVLQGLGALGHTVKLWGVSSAGVWERGRFEPGALPFEAERLDCTPREFHYTRIPARIAESVAAWRPDAVLVADGFFMKPYVVAALTPQFPVAVRYYAHELACPRSLEHHYQNEPCGDSYALNPERCRTCALEALAPGLRSGVFSAWSEEYVAARAFAPEYLTLQQDALRQAACAVVYNEAMAAHAARYFDTVFVAPGGIDVVGFPAATPPKREPGASRVIFMPGRGEAPAKGWRVLAEAADRLAQIRSDFEVHATIPQTQAGQSWARPLGWLSHETLSAYYLRSDICVVPSVWEEPFGMVALEAMATGRPVCASRVGGLQSIVVHEETGFLFERGNSSELTRYLDQLLDNEPLRRMMGLEGRRRAESHYAWPKVIDTHYAPVLQHLAQWNPGGACG